MIILELWDTHYSTELRCTSLLLLFDIQTTKENYGVEVARTLSCPDTQNDLEYIEEPA